MKLSLRFLSDYLKLSVSPEELAHRLTLTGSKVETVEDLSGGIHNVVVGRILTVSPHPNADRLSICQVDVGRELQIVTGAKNVKPGDLVPVALDGARLPGDKVINTGDLRGVTSEGMLCSLKELNLTLNDFPYAEENGIFILQEDCTPGQDICKAVGLDDWALDFEITNNRPDCLSVLGLARECAATLGESFAPPTPACRAEGPSMEHELTVRIENPELCPRYSARLVRDVKIEPSPRWLRERLRASGLRPINNIVDITNYVMLEYGQPMHAFDYACLTDNTIVVRTARPGETLDTLDGNARTLTPEMLVIADAVRPVGVAGVMGGLNSEITENTRTIVFESANFNGPSIRKTALNLGFRTDSSSRFEKGLDITSTMPALERACQLVELLGAGVVAEGYMDVHSDLPAPRVLPLEPEKINALLGTGIAKEAMVGYLISLGFVVDGDSVTIPSWRADIEGMADLAEEVARLYGYDRLPSAIPPCAVRGAYTPKQQSERKLTGLCRALGFSEILTYSFMSASSMELLGLPEDSPLRETVAIENPLGEDSRLMRTTALPAMLETLARNQRNGNKEGRFFELAQIYRRASSDTQTPTSAPPSNATATTPPNITLPDERPMLMLAAYGEDDFYAFKGYVERILQDFRVSARFTARCDHPVFHPGRCADIISTSEDGTAAPLGVIGELHPAVADRFDLTGRVLLCELDARALWAASAPEAKFVPLPRFPAMRRDLALVCRKDLPVDDLLAALTRGAGQLLVQIAPFDQFTGKALPPDCKSVAIGLTFRAPDRTLTDAEADEAIQGALHAAEAECDARLRA